MDMLGVVLNLQDGEFGDIGEDFRQPKEVEERKSRTE